MDEITLDTDQQQLLDTVVRGGKNLFFTGSAGSGKVFDHQLLEFHFVDHCNTVVTRFD